MTVTIPAIVEAQHVLAGRYALISHLARGGMADVYVAEDRMLGRRVAVKVLHGQLARSDAFVERFRREAQAAAGLQHPNVVGIHDWGRDDEQGLYFMVMELIRGRNLRQVLKSEGALLPQRVAEIGSDVASALSAAHRAGVVHRDIKPANVLLTAEGAVKVTDFGIARAWDDTEELTRTGAVIGTATYFSPEQAQGLPVDARSDIYSLGVVLYELLAGRPPFTGESPVAVAYQHVREEAPLPTQFNSRIPAELEDIVMRALAKEPSERYQTADDMRDDLERFLAGITPVATEAADSATRLVAAANPGPSSPAPPPPRAPRPDYSAETYAEPTRIATSTWVVGVLAATALVGLALILLLRILSPGGEERIVAIPELTGSTVEDATDTLEGLGFVVAQDEMPSATVPIGLVAGTDPPAGTEAATGSTVTLLVSTGPGEVPVPNLIGLTLDQARSAILAAGLELGRIDFEVSLVVPADTLLGQDPLPGEIVPAGTPIDIVVSAGTDAIEMPDVVGKSEADALFTLAQAGFASEQIIVQEQASEDVLEGFVIATIPAAGQMVGSTTTITVFVSSGAPVLVPNVVGMTLEEAIRALEADDLVPQLGDPVEVPFGDENDGKVMEQNPPAGSAAEAGDRVTLRIGTSGEPVVVPNLVDPDNPLTFAEAKAKLEDLGLKAEQGANVEVEFGSPFEGKVAEQSPPPGAEVGAGDTVIISLGEAPDGVTVPDVVGPGMNEDQARVAIEAANLVFVRNPENRVVPYGDPCHLLAWSQTPPAGDLVAPQSQVVVQFCVQESGPRVPDLIGKTAARAEEMLQDVGLVPVADGVCDSGQPSNRVAWQEYAADTIRPFGSEVKYRMQQNGSGACPATS